MRPPSSYCTRVLVLVAARVVCRTDPSGKTRCLLTPWRTPASSSKLSAIHSARLRQTTKTMTVWTSSTKRWQKRSWEKRERSVRSWSWCWRKRWSAGATKCLMAEDFTLKFWEQVAQIEEEQLVIIRAKICWTRQLRGPTFSVRVRPPEVLNGLFLHHLFYGCIESIYLFYMGNVRFGWPCRKSSTRLWVIAF